MPATSAKQQRYMGMEYAKAKAGKKPDVKMTTAQLREFAHKPKGGFQNVTRKD